VLFKVWGPLFQKLSRKREKAKTRKKNNFVNTPRKRGRYGVRPRLRVLDFAILCLKATLL
jgi:hypothetical protein